MKYQNQMQSCTDTINLYRHEMQQGCCDIYVPLHMPEISESLWQMTLQVQKIAKYELHMEFKEKLSHSFHAQMQEMSSGKFRGNEREV